MIVSTIRQVFLYDEAFSDEFEYLGDKFNMQVNVIYLGDKVM